MLYTHMQYEYYTSCNVHIIRYILPMTGRARKVLGIFSRKRNREYCVPETVVRRFSTRTTTGNNDHDVFQIDADRAMTETCAIMYYISIMDC